MATEITSLSVKIGAEMSGFRRGLSQMSSALRRTESEVAEVAGRIGKTFSLYITTPLMAMGGVSMRTAASFESSMNRVQAVSGATAAEFRRLSGQARELGETTQYSASQAADAMGFLAMAGFKANEIVGAMPSTLQLAAAAQLDLARAADITSNILTGYGLAIEDLSRANDVLVKAFTSANTDLSMLGEAFKYAGPVAKGAGVAFEEAAAALGLMGNAGIQAGMAGTALRGAITRLLKPTAEVSRTLNRLGVTATNANGSLRSLADIVDDLEAAGATTADMMALFGQRAGPAMAALVDQGAAAMRELTAELENSGGTAQRIADTQMRGLSGALKELRSAVEGLAIAFAESGVLQSLTQMAKELATNIRQISRANPQILQWAAAIGAVAASIGPLLLLVSKLTVALRGLAIAFTVSTGGVFAIAGALAGVVTLFTKSRLEAARIRSEMERIAEAERQALAERISTPEGRRERITELEAELREVNRVMRSHERSVNLFREGAAQRGFHERNVKRLRAEGQRIIGEINQLRAQLNAVGAAAESDPPDLSIPDAPEIDAVADTHERLARTLRTVAGMQAVLGDAYDANRDAADAYRRAIQELLAEGVQPTNERLKYYVSRLNEVEAAIKATEDAERDLLNAERERARLQSQALAVVRQSMTATEEYREQLELLRVALNEGAISQDEFTRGVAYLEAQIRDVTGTLRDTMLEQGVAVGEALVRGILTGANNMRDILKNALINLAVGYVMGPLKLALGIASPSRVFRGYGEAIGDGLVLGIQSRAHAVQSAIGSLVATASPALPSSVTVSTRATSSSAPTINMPTLPAASDPFSVARDGEWMRIISETMRELEAAGAIRLGTVG